MTAGPTIAAPLEARRARGERLPAGAWLVPFADPRRWLDVAASLACDARIYVLPRSRADRAPSAALVVPESGGSGPREGAGVAIPYARVGPLYLPADAKLVPDVGPAALEAVLAAEVAALVPGLGLVGFRREDGLRPEQLVRPPRIDGGRWARAASAPRDPLAIDGFEVAAPAPDDGAALGIGDEPIEALPPAPEEGAPARGLPGLLGRAGTRVSGALARWLGAGGEAPGPLARWLARRSEVGALPPEGLDAARSRSLRRLLALLDADPDRGLRHAIPLAPRQEAPRGAPGADLPSRPADFDLTRIGGKGPVDAWRVARAVREELLQRYLKLAARELSRGRHRRAAYIYAELLGMLEPAAAILRRAGHHLEAAALYRDRLDRPSEAAQCLEAGGYLEEAAELFAEIGELERAGDIYAELGRGDRAERLYRRAVDVRLRAGDGLEAARILERRLDEPEAALATLREAWPASPQAEACLRERLRLLGRLGREEDARREVEALSGGKHPKDTWLALAGALAEVAREHKSPDVRLAARDGVRLAASAALPDASGGVPRVIGRALSRSHPDDPELARDALRYAEARRAQAARAAPGAGGRRGSVRIVSGVELAAVAPGVRWRILAATGELFYALGTRQPDGEAGELVVARGRWEGGVQSLAWPLRPPARGPFGLAVDPHVGNPLLVWRRGRGLGLRPRGFPGQGALPLPRRVTELRSGGQVIHAAMYARGGAVRTVRSYPLGAGGRTWVIGAERPGGSVFAVRPLPVPDLPAEARAPRVSLALAPDQETPIVLVGDSVLAAGSASPHRLEGPHHSLAAPPRGGPALAAVGLEDGVRLLLATAGYADGPLVAGGIARPLVAATRGGLVLALGRAGGRVYEAGDMRARRVADVGLPAGATVVGVAPAGGEARFGVLRADGEALLLEVSR